MVEACQALGRESGWSEKTGMLARAWWRAGKQQAVLCVSSYLQIYQAGLETTFACLSMWSTAHLGGN